MTKRIFGSPQVVWFYAVLASLGIYTVTNKVPIAIIMAVVVIILFKILKK